ncbi:hypothetical protein SBV1_410061 [Verrucomicrobia bacterium]|nr:hypothetical protein SBV1_410061 [Verrucomicrobiota bacterium]
MGMSAMSKFIGTQISTLHRGATILRSDTITNGVQTNQWNLQISQIGQIGQMRPSLCCSPRLLHPSSPCNGARITK